jgi:carboxyl-terminal processing protease
MKKYFAVGLLALLFAANLLILAPASFGLSGDYYSQMGLLVDVRHQLITGFVKKPSDKDMLEGAVRGMIESLGDVHTVYMSSEHLKRFDRETMGSFSGIGAEVSIDPNARRLKIVSPIEGSPAYREGVMAGDIVLKIDDKDTLGMELSDAVKNLIGKAGTDVTIEVRHESGDLQTITITRAQINVSTIRGIRRATTGGWDFMLDPVNKIGYVRLRQFSESTADDLRQALKGLMDDGMRGLILDLRFNPGGLLTSAVEVADLFLDPDQDVVSVKGRTVAEYIHRSEHKQVTGGAQIVVLANGGSASAAEIVAGALADNLRAKFIGSRTFGKGSVQQLRMLDGGQGALKMTNAYWYTPNGKLIHKVTVKDEDKANADEQPSWGVDPDDGFFVVMSPKQMRAMIEIRRNSDVLHRTASDENAPIKQATLTPESIEQDLKDLQLAAGLKAIIGKLDSGDWPVVGKAGADLLVKQIKIEQLISAKQRYLEELARIEGELKQLQSGAEETVQADPDASAPNTDTAVKSVQEPEPVVAP